MRIAYFDPYSGASGDMVLGALVDSGLLLDDLRSILRGLDVTGYEIISERVVQHGIVGTRIRVEVSGHQTPRNWSQIRSLLEQARLPGPVQEASLATFKNLADAEARVHGVAVDDVHFHEVGGVDAIVDIVGAAAGLHLLHIDAVYAGPPALGRGFAHSMHGVIPVPAPATAQLLAAAGAPSKDVDVDAELLTPTGAAILTTLAEFQRPPFRTTAVGYGFGRRELQWPNALRLWIGELEADQDEPIPEAPSTRELMLETNIDDMNPEFFELLIERLFEAGALDVYLTPITMKRGRPATKISVVGNAADRVALEETLIENSTTFGVRVIAIDRTKVDRDWESVATRWGDVRLKLKIWRGRVLDAVPEYADCLDIARSSGAPVHLVYREASRMGEVYIGQRRQVVSA